MLNLFWRFFKKCSQCFCGGWQVYNRMYTRSWNTGHTHACANTHTVEIQDTHMHAHARTHTHTHTHTNPGQTSIALLYYCRRQYFKTGKKSMVRTQTWLLRMTIRCSQWNFVTTQTVCTTQQTKDTPTCILCLSWHTKISEFGFLHVFIKLCWYQKRL